MESEVLGAAVAVAASWWQAAPPASSAPWGPPAPIATAWPSAPRFPRPHAHVPSALDSVSAVTSVTPELAAAPKANSSAASGAAPLLCGCHPHRLGDPPVSAADAPAPAPPLPSVCTNRPPQLLAAVGASASPALRPHGAAACRASSPLQGHVIVHSRWTTFCVSIIRPCTLRRLPPFRGCDSRRCEHGVPTALRAPSLDSCGPVPRRGAPGSVCLLSEAPRAARTAAAPSCIPTRRARGRWTGGSSRQLDSLPLKAPGPRGAPGSHCTAPSFEVQLRPWP